MRAESSAFARASSAAAPMSPVSMFARRTAASGRPGGPYFVRRLARPFDKRIAQGGAANARRPLILARKRRAGEENGSTLERCVVERYEVISKKALLLRLLGRRGNGIRGSAKV